VTDGGAGDLDGLVDGNVHTTWFVDPDDSLDSSFDLTAAGLTSSLSASNTFTDSQSAEPRIDIEKSTNGVDADSGTGPLIAAGDTVTFTYRVTNVGNVALMDVAVLDDQLGAITNLISNGNGDAILDAGEHWIYETTAIATPGQYVNEGSVTASDALGEQVSDSELSHYFGVVSGIDIEKLANGQDADFPKGPVVEEGSLVTFTFVVTNTGNVPLKYVDVLDDNGTPGDLSDDFYPTYVSGDTNNDYVLDVNETWIYTAELPALLGQQVNIADAWADDPLYREVHDYDKAYYFGERPLIVIGPDKGNTSVPIVKVVDKRDGSVVNEFLAYEASFRGGVRVATGDMDGDGIDEIITAPGRGRDAEVRVFKQDGTELTQFRTLAFSSNYQGGISIAVADVNGDGTNDIIVGTSMGRSKVKIFFNDALAVDPISDTFDIKIKPFKKSFLGGVDVAAADMGTFSNGMIVDANTPDGRAEVIVSTGSGMTAKIKVYDLSNGAKVVDKITPFGSSFRGGITVDTARIDGDLIPDLIVSAGNGKKSKVKIFNGLTNDATDQLMANFKTFADRASRNAPVHATGVDTDFDGIADYIAVVQGTDGDSDEIRYFTTDGLPVAKQSGFEGPWNIASIQPMINEELEYEMYLDEFFQD